MTNRFDLHVLSLTRATGQEQPDLPGLYLAEQPRRTARGRENDRLFFYARTLPDPSLQHNQQRQILVELAKSYYQTSGSVTSTLRYIIEKYNQMLFNQNLPNQTSGQRKIGLFIAIVLRGEQIIIALSGPIHLYTLTDSGADHLYDPEISGSGLGVSRTTTIRYFQASLQANDTFILVAQPDSPWESGQLNGWYGQGPESIRRRLVSQAQDDLAACLIQARPGKNQVHILRAAPPQGIIQPDTPLHRPAAATSRGVAPKSSTTTQQMGYPEPGKAVAGQPAASQSETQSGSPRPSTQGAFWRLLATLTRPIVGLLRWLGRVFRLLFTRILPEGEQQLSGSMMAFIALAVPVVVVTIASVVYLRRGLSTEAQAIYQQAVDTARSAENQKEPATQRETWQKVLQLIDQSEAYQKSPETDALRTKATNSLDELDLVRRLNYQPAIAGDLAESFKIAQIVVSNNTLYLLDGNSGNVLQATATGQGYKLDSSYQCGPGATGGIGPLVGLVAWPAEYKPQADIVGVDASGRLVYCSTGKAPTLGSLTNPKDTNLGTIAAIMLNLGTVYLLDTSNEAVWIYLNGVFDKPPEPFFENKPPRLSDAIDLAINHNELYVLHKDGRLTLCFSGIGDTVPTRCTSPTPLMDVRPGHENSPMTLEHPFSHLFFSPPPDPSLYFLEPDAQGIYRFSLRNVIFQNQYLPQSNYRGQVATAFAINQVERLFFLALGNRVYYATIP